MDDKIKKSPCIPRAFSSDIREEGFISNIKSCKEAKDIHKYTVEKIFPVLIPALESMLCAAEKEQCFERKYTRFRPLDYLTEYLYNNNPKYPERKRIEFPDIPFVKRWLNWHPRIPLSKFLIWSSEEAAIIIQAHFRGFLVRKQPEIQEFRQYQKELKTVIGKKANGEVKLKKKTCSKYHALLEEYLGHEMKTIYLQTASKLHCEMIDDITEKSYETQVQKMYEFYSLRSSKAFNIHKLNTACQSQMEWREKN